MTKINKKGQEALTKAKNILEDVGFNVYAKTEFNIVNHEINEFGSSIPEIIQTFSFSISGSIPEDLIE